MFRAMARRPADPQYYPSVLGHEQPLSAVRLLGEADVLDGTPPLGAEPDRYYFRLIPF